MIQVNWRTNWHPNIQLFLERYLGISMISEFNFHHLFLFISYFLSSWTTLRTESFTFLHLWKCSFDS